MATQTTPNRLIRYDDLPDTADAKRLGQNLATDLDNVANIYAGTLAARDAATAAAGHGEGNPGSFYLATDTGELFVSIAGAWIKVTTEPGIPIGGMFDYAGAGDPADTRFLLADGRSLLRAGTYAPLFGVIGTSNGSVDGTHFNLPDGRGRVFVGLDNMGTAMGDAARLTANDSRGQSGGEEKHATVEAEMFPHHHNVQYATRASGTLNTGGGPVMRGNGSGTLEYLSRSDASILETTVGSGTPHNNMQPHSTQNKLIRVR